ncbi:MAG: hypothetical protein NVSMB14_02500 [Isosphaeraceae bacterium]
MSPPRIEASRPILIPLEWDAAHFGLATARLEPADLGDDALKHGLQDARRRRVRLVYWFADPDRPPILDELAREFSARLVDRKATYLADRLSIDIESPARADEIREEPRGPASKRLCDLAVAAGEFSRFRVDPKIPAGKFEEMYETWIDRSTRRELADSVFVAVRPDLDDEPIGMITLSVQGDEGTIGLIAVDAQARGLGIGSLLIDAAHRRMISLGATRARVVTQLDNNPACRLYEKHGYRLAELRHCHHFWP